MITLYKEYAIGIKKLSEAELDRESSPSGQTHIGLSEKVFTFLPNTPKQVDGILVFNKSCTMVECAFSKIGNKRSTKIDSQTTNPVKSLVKQVRNIASNANVDWYLVWFALENQMPVFWLINSSSDDYADLKHILVQCTTLTVFKASKDEYFDILSKVRGIKKLFQLTSGKFDLSKENRLVATSSEHRTFVHLSLDYFRVLGVLDKMVAFFNTTNQNAPITVTDNFTFKLLNMFMFADDDELQRRNSTDHGRRWYTDPFVVENRKLYLYVDWFPGKDSKGKDMQLMIPDFATFVKLCFGDKYVYRNAQGTHELWEINTPEDFNIIVENNESSTVPDHLIKFKHLLEYFCTHLHYIVTDDKNVKGYSEYLQKFVDNGTFKKSGQGWCGHSIQNQVKKWEEYPHGKICICVYGSSFQGRATYLHWDTTGHNISANWDGNTITSLQCVEFREKEGKKSWEEQPTKFTLDELGLYVGQMPNENVKAFYDAFAKMLENDDHQVSENLEDHEPLDFIQSAQQIIYYGAPGTGKSHTIKKKEEAGLACIRTTFHPDSDYATFVGCYKPHRIKEGERKGEITYEFVEQAFLEAYKMAWLNPDQETALVIEEINRGNCAQVFGDIFQLLDRDEDGWSTYPIKADTDICDHLEALALPGYNETMMAHFGKDKGGYRFMALPPNLSILATMNTSDQSLFPIDSAFKRRWDWKYVPISQGCDKEGNLLAWTIESDAADKDWWHFLMSINGIIHSVTKSEDKELGFFFTKADAQGVISAEKFVNKVVFYLWTDVFKTYGFRSDIFDKDPDGKEKLAFKDFYQKDGSVNMKTVKLFIENVRKHLPKDEEPEVEETKNDNPVEE